MLFLYYQICESDWGRDILSGLAKKQLIFITRLAWKLPFDLTPLYRKPKTPSSWFLFLRTRQGNLMLPDRFCLLCVYVCVCVCVCVCVLKTTRHRVKQYNEKTLSWTLTSDNKSCLMSSCRTKNGCVVNPKIFVHEFHLTINIFHL